MQDTVRQKILAGTDTLKHSNDTVSGQFKVSQDIPLAIRETTPVKKTENISVDTTAVCKRNPIADITFYDSTNIVTRIDESVIGRFPFVFTELNARRKEEARASLVRHLKAGNEIPEDQYHIDWIVPVILVSAFLYALVRTRSGSAFRGLLRFI
jgi:hypothetical protein